MQNWFGWVPAVTAIGVAGGMTGWFLLDDIGFVAMTFGMASIAGAVCLVGFGRAGVFGWIAAWLSAIGATALAPFLFGLFFNGAQITNLIGAVFGTLFHIPAASVLWGVCMAIGHLAAGHWRRKRNSEFRNKAAVNKADCGKRSRQC